MVILWKQRHWLLLIVLAVHSLLCLPQMLQDKSFSHGGVLCYFSKTTNNWLDGTQFRSNQIPVACGTTVWCLFQWMAQDKLSLLLLLADFLFGVHYESGGTSSHWFLYTSSTWNFCVNFLLKIRVHSFLQLVYLAAFWICTNISLNKPFLLLMDTNITNSDSVLLTQMPVNSSTVQTDFLTFAFAPLGELKGTWLKMEFENLKSSAALIYDEFIQNAGQYLELQ